MEIYHLEQLYEHGIQTIQSVSIDLDISIELVCC